MLFLKLEGAFVVAHGQSILDEEAIDGGLCLGSTFNFFHRVEHLRFIVFQGVALIHGQMHLGKVQQGDGTAFLVGQRQGLLQAVFCFVVVVKELIGNGIVVPNRGFGDLILSGLRQIQGLFEIDKRAVIFIDDDVHHSHGVEALGLARKAIAPQFGGGFVVADGLGLMAACVEQVADIILREGRTDRVADQPTVFVSLFVAVHGGLVFLLGLTHATAVERGGSSVFVVFPFQEIVVGLKYLVVRADVFIGFVFGTHLGDDGHHAFRLALAVARWQQQE